MFKIVFPRIKLIFYDISMATVHFFFFFLQALNLKFLQDAQQVQLSENPVVCINQGAYNCTIFYNRIFVIKNR